MNVKEWTLKEYVENWKRLGPELEKLRREKIRHASLADSIRALDGAFRSAIWLNKKPRPSSGLVEFHKIMSKSR
jgi:hypothetical protein